MKITCVNTSRKLYIYLSMLAHEDEAGNPGKYLKKEGVISVLSVLQSIRNAEDAVDAIMSKVQSHTSGSHGNIVDEIVT